jgi:hypothetical protein
MGRTKIAGFHRKSYKTLQVMARKNADFHHKINGMGVNGRVKVSQRAAQNVATLVLARLPLE